MSIAFDNTQTATNGATSALTWSHTTVGNSRLLVVGVIETTPSDDVTGVTYAGIALTFIAKVTNSTSQVISLYYLISPALGANNVIVSASGAVSLRGYSSSFTGVKQKTLNASITNTTLGSATFTLTLTTTVENCWVIGTAKNNAGDTTAGANTSVRSFSAGDGTSAFDSNAARAAGSNALNVATSAGLTDWAGVAAAFEPATGGMLMVF